MASAFCSQRARSHDVSPVGTATEAVHWLLIEDPSPWGEHAIRDADWHPEVGDAIAKWKDAVPDLRVQLIRRGLKTWDAPGQIRCLAVRTGPQSVVRDWTVEAYANLTALDVPGALQASPPEANSEPLVLTCVNGRRDACCAKWGRPVAQAAAEAAPEDAWQTSHLGGHRFAPTVLVLPHGTHYGWLRPDDLPELVAAHRRGQLYDLDRVRGAVHQPRPVQAADLALRSRSGITDVAGVQGALEAGGDGCWTVRLQAQGRTHTARVRRREREAVFPHSCGSGEAKADVAWDVTWDEPVHRQSEP
ncbi:MAG: sucrase ferredoxin [Salinivenus sp.]